MDFPPFHPPILGLRVDEKQKGKKKQKRAWRRRRGIKRKRRRRTVSENWGGGDGMIWTLWVPHFTQLNKPLTQLVKVLIPKIKFLPRIAQTKKVGTQDKQYQLSNRWNKEPSCAPKNKEEKGSNINYWKGTSMICKIAQNNEESSMRNVLILRSRFQEKENKNGKDFAKWNEISLEHMNNWN